MNIKSELTWEYVHLLDDGTMDTVVEINGHEMRYSDTSDYRTETGDFSDKGWKEFAEMVLADYLNDFPNESETR